MASITTSSLLLHQLLTSTTSHIFVLSEYKSTAFTTATTTLTLLPLFSLILGHILHKSNKLFPYLWHTTQVLSSRLDKKIPEDRRSQSESWWTDRLDSSSLPGTDRTGWTGAHQHSSVLSREKERRYYIVSRGLGGLTAWTVVACLTLTGRGGQVLTSTVVSYQGKKREDIT